MTPSMLPPSPPSNAPPLAASSGEPPKRLTADEFFERYGNLRVELVNGLVEELPMPGFVHGRAATKMTSRLDQYAEQRNQGRVFSHDAFVLLKRDPDLVRGVDIAYVSYERLPREQNPVGILDAIPELVVEVRSPSDLWTKVFTKVGEYLEAGVRIVVILDPETQTASVYRPDVMQQVYTIKDELTLPDLLPDFRVPIAKLFE